MFLESAMTDRVLARVAHRDQSERPSKKNIYNPSLKIGIMIRPVITVSRQDLLFNIFFKVINVYFINTITLHSIIFKFSVS